MNQPLLFRLPPELLSFISVYCYSEFRTACKFMKQVAYPWLSVKDSAGTVVQISAKAKTQVNCLILGIPVNPDFLIGKNIDKLLYLACYAGNKYLVNWCVAHGSHDYKEKEKTGRPILDLENAIGYAKFGKYQEIIDYIISLNGGSIPHNWVEDEYDIYLQGACRDNDLPFAKWCVEQGAYYTNRGAEVACRHGNLELVQFCISENESHDYSGSDPDDDTKGKDWDKYYRKDIKWSELEYQAHEGGHPEVIEFLNSYRELY